MCDVPRVDRLEQFIHQELQHRRARVARATSFDLLHDLRDCYSASEVRLKSEPPAVAVGKSGQDRRDSVRLNHVRTATDSERLNSC
jgi:hypothetical protein